jgi:SAM-dependent methyltransferase
MRRHVALEGQAILDVGCGVGAYVRAFGQYSDEVHGIDIDPEKVAEARQVAGARVMVASAEALPYADGRFDVVLSHEVIEHVADDRRAVAEAVRVLRPPRPGGRAGGRLVIFCPNRLYPFETHGAYWAGTYHFGNIPLVNYLPDRWRNRFCPHVRAYLGRDLRALLVGLPVRVVAHRGVFPGYDKVVRRRPALGRWLRRVTYLMEGTPLRGLGLSHLLVVERTR